MASWPAVVLAVAVAVVVSRHLDLGLVAVPQEEPQGLVHRRDWAVMAILLAVTLAAPMAILPSGVGQVEGMADYWVVIRDKAAGSVLAAVAAAALALAMAGGAMAAERLGLARHGPSAGSRASRCWWRCSCRAAWWVRPSSRPRRSWLCRRRGARGGGSSRSARPCGLPAWPSSCFAPTSYDADRHLEEMAGIDGAGWWAVWWQVRWPGAWPLVTGAGLMVVLLSLSEVQTTMMVLPAGVPNFTQHLFNQMHYFRDRNVIASCLLLMALYLAPAVPVVMLVVHPQSPVGRRRPRAGDGACGGRHGGVRRAGSAEKAPRSWRSSGPPGAGP